MFSDKYAFSQLIEFIHLEQFQRYVRRYEGNYKIKSFSCWDQFLQWRRTILQKPVAFHCDGHRIQEPEARRGEQFFGSSVLVCFRPSQGDKLRSRIG